MIGSLRNQITLLAKVEAEDSTGGRTVSWSPDADLWTRIEFLSSVSAVTGDRGVRLRRLSATIRRRASVTPGDRFRFDGTDYEVTSIEQADDSRHKIVLIGEEVVR
ncbi:MAG: phage head closure protein [Pseudomonadota bacterium]